MKTRIALFLISVLISNAVNASGTTIIDNRRVYNPELNICAAALNNALPKRGFAERQSVSGEFKQAERIFLNWLSLKDCPAYMHEFDTSTFHYQFVESRLLGENKTGIILIIPDEKVGPDFYTQLGAGLEIPGTRCMEAHCSWINNGEIFSFVVDRETESIESFKNWRFEKEYDNFNPLMAYYSQLTVHYKCKTDKAEKTTIVQFVDGVSRTEIPAWENYPIMLPKGKISVLVFYSENMIKGVLCFDMREISKGCPMNFESTVYMKERLGYERILYAQPKCEGIYEVKLLQKTQFEEISNLRWDDISEFKEDVAIN